MQNCKQWAVYPCLLCLEAELSVQVIHRRRRRVMSVGDRDGPPVWTQTATFQLTHHVVWVVWFNWDTFMTLITLNFNCLTAINEFRVPELSIKIHLIPSITAISHLPHQLSTSPALPIFWHCLPCYHQLLHFQVLRGPYTIDQLCQYWAAACPNSDLSCSGYLH